VPPAPGRMTRLLDLYARLPAPAVGRLSGLPIPACPSHRVARTSADEPCILIHSPDRTGRAYSIELENLLVEHDVRCDIVRPDGGEEHERFSVITCRSTEPALRQQFLAVCELLIENIGAEPHAAAVNAAIERIVRLFRALLSPPAKSVQGLWAELFLIASSQDPAVLAAAWHLTPLDAFDFNAGQDRIEVKSCAGRFRVHHFSFDQVRPPATTEALVVSMFVRASSGGTSIRELISEIRRHLGERAEGSLRVETLSAESLGTDYLRALDYRFDRHFAEQSLQFFEARAVPAPCEVLPTGVSHVHFQASLDGCFPVSAADMDRRPLFRAALAR
jgi:hypothetical protein